jgi:hypothetical protein
MNSKLRSFVKLSRRNLRKTSKFIYDNFYACMTDEEYLADMNTRKALLNDRRPGEVIHVAIQYPNGDITSMGQILIQDQSNN